jgi:hypothetical protein
MKTSKGPVHFLLLLLNTRELMTEVFILFLESAVMVQGGLFFP